MNDTGCNIQTILSTDLTALGYNQLTYRGHRGTTELETAGGVIRRRRIVIETQIMKAYGTAITPWFRQSAVVLPLQAGIQYRAFGKSDTKSSLLRNCSRKCESLRRAEEKWHYNPTSRCISSLMYGIRALVRHKLGRLMVLLLLL